MEDRQAHFSTLFDLNDIRRRIISSARHSKVSIINKRKIDEISINADRRRILEARTDVETTYATVWNILKRCPIITLKHSKVVVRV